MKPVPVEPLPIALSVTLATSNTLPLQHVKPPVQLDTTQTPPLETVLNVTERVSPALLLAPRAAPPVLLSSSRLH